MTGHKSHVNGERVNGQWWGDVKIRYPGGGIEADLADLLEDRMQRWVSPDTEWEGMLFSRSHFCEITDEILDLLRQKGIQIP